MLLTRAHFMRNTVFMAHSFLFFLLLILLNLAFYFVTFVQKGIQLLHLICAGLGLLILLSLGPAPFINDFLLMFVDLIKLAISFAKVIFKVSFVDLLMCPQIDSESFLFVNAVGASVNFVLILPDSIAVPNSMLKVSLIKAAISPVVLPISIGYAIHVLAYIAICIGK